MVERVRTYQKNSVTERPATEPVTGVRFPVRQFYSSSRLFWYLKALHLPLTSAISREMLLLKLQRTGNWFWFPSLGTRQRRGFTLLGSSLYILTGDEENRYTARNVVV